jgi:hypothetical protein
MRSRVRSLTVTVVTAVGTALGAAALPLPPAGAVAPDPIAGPDFNGDGYGDLVLPVPEENDEAGIVHVIPGSASGPQPALSRVWSQDSPDIGDSSEPDEYFGRSWTYGDLDGDGYDDLVVGVPGESIGGATGAGAIHVIYGGSHGLTAAGDTIISRASLISPGVPSAGEGFGRAVTTGDFDGDGYDDLATSAWTTVDGAAAAGSVIVFGWGPAGPNAGFEFSQSGSFVGDSPEPGDLFGYSLAAGDFNGDGRDDLAVGIPFENTNGAIDGGAVAVLRGSDIGIVVTGDQLFTQASTGILDMPDANDLFGFSLVAGRLDGDGRDDLAVGIPGESASGMGNAGALAVLRGWENGLTSIGNVLVNRTTPGVPGSPGLVDYFGLALHGADFDGNGQLDLAVGLLTDVVDGVTSGGSVITLYGGPGFIASPGSGSEIWSQNSPGIGDMAEPYDYFGAAVRSADVDDNGRADLVVFVPGEPVSGNPGAGAAHLLFGTASGLTAAASKIYHQDTPGIGDVAEPGDSLGLTVIV